MKTKKKIIFFEPHMDSLRGHHMDSAIAKSIKLQKFGEIFWLVSNKFNKDHVNIPNYISVLNVLDTAKRKISFFKIINTFNTLFLIIKNFFFSLFIIFCLVKKNNLSWIRIFYFNFFSFPKYLPSIFFSFENLQITHNDHVIFNSCSDLNDYELAIFLYSYKKQSPTFHLFIRTFPKFKKIRSKNSFYFLKKINKMSKLNAKFNFYAETKEIKNYFYKSFKIKVNLFHDFYLFSSKTSKPKKINIGFFGEARKDKGFVNYSSLIKSCFKINSNLNFIIQFSSVPYELQNAKENLLNYAYKNNKIKIITKYLDYFEYRKLLKKIHIVPILHDPKRIGQIGSGVIFSCITNEIPMILPKNNHIKKNFDFKFYSYLEADSIEEYANKILEIQGNYDYFLNQAKMEAKYFREKFKNYPFLERIKKTI